MPKRRRRKDDDDDESSESEYEEDSRDDNDEDDEPASDLQDEEQEDDDDAEDEDGNEQHDDDDDKVGRPRNVASAPKYSKKKAAVPRSSSSVSKNRSSLSTDDRKTAAGGYSHTVESKLRISQANRGNTPWNKGRNRSELDKANITAGVRARNHLLAKKQREAYGLAEAEADQYKRRIKYMREKVRRLRADNDKRQDAKREGREAWVKVEHMAIGGRSRSVAVRRTTRGRPRRAAAESDSSASVSSSGSSEDDSSGSDGEGNETAKEASRDSTSKIADPTKRQSADLTGPELVWTAHPMDNMEMRHMCSRGGPGGFGCCPDCTTQCTQYMVATFAELEKQKISNVGIQVQQLQEISAACSRRLEQTARATRRKPTPLLLASYRRPQAPTTVPHASSATVVVAPLPDASGGTEVYEV